LLILLKASQKLHQFGGFLDTTRDNASILEYLPIRNILKAWEPSLNQGKNLSKLRQFSFKKVTIKLKVMQILKERNIDVLVSESTHFT